MQPQRTNRVLRTAGIWKDSLGPAQPARWRQAWTWIGSPAAPTRPKPRAILKARNQSDLLTLQPFMAAEAQRATAIPAARASLALLAMRLGLIRTRQWRSADRGTGFEIPIVPPDRGDMPIDVLVNRGLPDYICSQSSRFWVQRLGPNWFYRHGPEAPASVGGPKLSER